MRCSACSRLLKCGYLPVSRSIVSIPFTYNKRILFGTNTAPCFENGTKRPRISFGRSMSLMGPHIWAWVKGVVSSSLSVRRKRKPQTSPGTGSLNSAAAGSSDFKGPGSPGNTAPVFLLYSTWSMPPYLTETSVVSPKISALLLPPNEPNAKLHAWACSPLAASAIAFVKSDVLLAFRRCNSRPSPSMS